MPPVNQITADIIDALIHIHADLGPGVLKSADEQLLAAELSRRGLCVKRQRVVAFEYKGTAIEFGFRLDLLVEGRLPVRRRPSHRRRSAGHERLSRRG